jgi:ATP-dependent exoDNAse (exonuclease V) beta subunit
LDYKTDRLTNEERKDRALAEKKLRDAHSLQLNYYSMAIKKMFGKEPSTVRIYSLPLGDCVTL